jgi:AcrR family transcriptional regulator
MDRRQRKTREAIFSAFSELLEKHKYENITVQDIIDKADIGRSTFYSHFETKDALLKALCSDIFEHIFKGEICNYPGENHSIEEKLAHILWHIKDNKKDVTGLLNCESSELFMAYIREFLYELFRMYIYDFSKNVPEDFLLNHLVNSFCTTIQWWVKNKMAISPEETANYFIELFA